VGQFHHFGGELSDGQGEKVSRTPHSALVLGLPLEGAGLRAPRRNLRPARHGPEPSPWIRASSMNPRDWGVTRTGHRNQPRTADP
jgi:hypothetical protein